MWSQESNPSHIHVCHPKKKTTSFLYKRKPAKNTPRGSKLRTDHTNAVVINKRNNFTPKVSSEHFLITHKHSCAGNVANNWQNGRVFHPPNYDPMISLCTNPIVRANLLWFSQPTTLWTFLGQWQENPQSKNKGLLMVWWDSLLQMSSVPKMKVQVIRKTAGRMVNMTGTTGRTRKNCPRSTLSRHPLNVRWAASEGPVTKPTTSIHFARTVGL